MSNDMSKFTNADVADSMVRLFNVVPLSFLTADTGDDDSKIGFDQILSQHLVIMRSDRTVLTEVTARVMRLIRLSVGYDSYSFNQSLHKSYQKVANMTAGEFYLQQIIHYFSVYAPEMHGYQLNMYIPCEKLELEDSDDLEGDTIQIIFALTDQECLDLIKRTFKTVQRPNAMLIDYYDSLVQFISKPENIASFELKAQWYLLNNTAPKDPQDFLRLVVYLLTGSTLLIKNDITIRAIRGALSYDNKAYEVLALFQAADLEVLSSIFLRYKPIFLAFKQRDMFKPIINKLRRLAVVNHVPLGDVNVRNLTNLVKEMRIDDVRRVLKNASIRDLVKIINFALSHDSMQNGDSEAYNVRNGKVFVKAKDKVVNDNFLGREVTAALYLRVKDKLKNKVFILPSFMKYAVPYSEKQMVNTIPMGSYIPLSKGGYSLGIHWLNGKRSDGGEYRTDLDLHLSGNRGNNYGWNSQFKNNSTSIVYSGDVVNAPAPHGATESFFVNGNITDDESFRVSVSRYCGNSEFKFFFAPHHLEKNHVFNSKEILFAPVPLSFPNEAPSAELGLLTNDGFYFATGTIERVGARVPNRNITAEYIAARRRSLKYRLHMEDLLKWAGAVVLTDKNDIDDIPDECTEAVNMMPEFLTTTTFFDILDSLEEK